MRIKLALLVHLIFGTFVNAQIYTPIGTIQGASTNNNVGIGTSTPSNLLHLFTNSNIPLKIESTNIEAYINMRASGSDTNYGALLRVFNNDFGIYHGNGVFNSLYIKGSDGNVGIGTSNPTAKLHVEGDTYLGTNQLQFLSSNGGNNRIQSFGGVITGSWLIKSRFDNIVIDAGENTSNKRKIVFKIGGVDKMLLDFSGNFGIGTTTPDEKLTVKGKIHAEEVRIDLGIPAPDYVFASDYKLKTLQEVEAYIKENNHLLEIPSAQEIDKNGLMLAEMNMALLKKIEEMTLYMIEQNKRIEKLEKNIKNN
nr:tail fiber protein [uncultured Flavobacterium sp.]